MLALLIACVEPPDRTATLPRLATAALVFENGNAASIVIDLDHPKAPPRVRYADGLVVFDGEHLGEPTAGGFVDPLDGVQLSPSAEPVHIDGPGDGFTLWVDEGRLLLKLPHMGSPIPFLEGVDHAESLALLTPSELDEIGLERLNLRFKGARPLRAARADATIDGAMGEWRHQKALPVDDRDFTQDGEAWWEGPDDAGMSLAARFDGEDLFLAVRLRDDQITTGDRVEIRTGWSDERLSFPLLGAACSPPSCGIVETIHGVSMEIALPAGADPDSLNLPLVVSFYDHDGSDPPTILANARSLEALAMKGRAPRFPGGRPSIPPG